MSVQNWLDFFLLSISSAYNWLTSITLFAVPVIYILLAILILGVVLRAVLYKA